MEAFIAKFLSFCAHLVILLITTVSTYGQNMNNANFNWNSSTAKVGIGTSNPTVPLQVNGATESLSIGICGAPNAGIALDMSACNSAMVVPSGNTAQRTAPTFGSVRWNTDNSAMEVANGSSWSALPAAQIQSNWNEANSSFLDYIQNKPSIVNYAYDNTTKYSNVILLSGNISVSSGVAATNLTIDGTSGGVPICPTGVISDSVNASINDATAIYPVSFAFSNSNKTLTFTVNKASPTGLISLLGLNLLGAPIAAANGVNVKYQLQCY